ncbi:DUF4271 domain-containing protein [Luteibaculum oceani]
MSLVVRPNQESDNNSLNFLNVSLTTLGWLNVAFTINLVGQYFNWDAFSFTGSYSYLVSAIGVAFWIAIYMLLFNFGFWLSDENRVFLYLKNSFYRVFRFYGLIGVPINLLLIFIPLGSVKPLLYLAIALILILLGIRIIQGINFSVKKGLSIWYIILYLCALEITPLLCLAKAII